MLLLDSIHVPGRDQPNCTRNAQRTRHDAFPPHIHRLVGPLRRLLPCRSVALSGRAVRAAEVEAVSGDPPRRERKVPCGAGGGCSGYRIPDQPVAPPLPNEDGPKARQREVLPGSVSTSRGQGH